MLQKTGFRVLSRSRTWRACAAAALVAASIAVGTAPVMASTAAFSHGNRDLAVVGAATTPLSLLIEQKQAWAQAQMTKAGDGPSFAGNSSPAGN